MHKGLSKALQNYTAIRRRIKRQLGGEKQHPCALQIAERLKPKLDGIRDEFVTLEADFNDLGSDESPVQEFRGQSAELNKLWSDIGIMKQQAEEFRSDARQEREQQRNEAKAAKQVFDTQMAGLEEAKKKAQEAYHQAGQGRGLLFHLSGLKRRKLHQLDQIWDKIVALAEAGLDASRSTAIAELDKQAALLDGKVKQEIGDSTSEWQLEEAKKYGGKFVSLVELAILVGGGVCVDMVEEIEMLRLDLDGLQEDSDLLFISPTALGDMLEQTTAIVTPAPLFNPGLIKSLGLLKAPEDQQRARCTRHRRSSADFVEAEVVGLIGMGAPESASCGAK